MRIIPIQFSAKRLHGWLRSRLLKIHSIAAITQTQGLFGPGNNLTDPIRWEVASSDSEPEQAAYCWVVSNDRVCSFSSRVRTSLKLCCVQVVNYTRELPKKVACLQDQMNYTLSCTYFCHGLGLHVHPLSNQDFARSDEL